MADHVFFEVQEHFIATYRAAGGEIDSEVFSGPRMDRAIAMFNACIPRQSRPRQPAG